jgi:hypothetical protein
MSTLNPDFILSEAELEEILDEGESDVVSREAAINAIDVIQDAYADIAASVQILRTLWPF